MFGRRAQVSSRLFCKTYTVLVLFLSLSISAHSQQQTQPAASSSSGSQVIKESAVERQKEITVPAGTRIALVLTHPIDSKSIHKGDLIYAQTTAPVIGNDHLAIPAGTFVQGSVGKLARQGTRGEISLESVAFVFPNGYIASLSGAAKAQSEEGTAYRNPNSGAKIGALAAPAAGLAVGAAIGSSVHTMESSSLGGRTLTASSPKGIAIGSMVGLAAGSAVSIVLLASAHHFYVDAGSAMQLVLPRPVSLDAAQVAAAARMPQSLVQPIVVKKIVPVPFPSGSTNIGTCYTPGSSGTPDTVIPGTPPIGNSPGTPPTVIPGIPATPPTPYPCP